MDPGLDVLFFGRGKPDYSRNRVLIDAFAALGHRVRWHRPRFSRIGDFEAAIRGLPKPSLVWVPCFRQRDLHAASRAAKRWNVPLVLDPLISAYDKQVFERRKFSEDARSAKRLLAYEQSVFTKADMVVADTAAHAGYFRDTLGVPADKLHVIPVGAEAALFSPRPMPALADRPLEALFYGSFIHLQGPEVIVDAARQCPHCRFTLLGRGPLKAVCQKAARGLTNVRFEPPMAYGDLPGRIAKADILLGVFSASDKARRVIPNKVYQALACGRPVVTRVSDAYPPRLSERPAMETGLNWVLPEDPAGLAACLNTLSNRRDDLSAMGASAAASYASYLGPDAVRRALEALLLQVQG